MPEDNQKIGLSKEQKIGFVLLSIFAVFAIGLGVLQIRNTMYGPFALTREVPPLDASQTDNVEALKYRDTDHDTLSDYDELYVFATSPYLADTDSDGIPDNLEIKNGTNPACNEKLNDCSGASVDNGNAMPTINATSSEYVGETPVEPGTAPDDLNSLVSDPAKIRQVLLDQGMDKKVLDATTDAELLQMIKETMSSTTAASGASQ